MEPSQRRTAGRPVRGVQELSLASQRRLLGICHPPVEVTPDAASFVSAAATSAPFYTATLPAPDADPGRVVAQAREVSGRSGRHQYIWAPQGSDLAGACEREGLRDAGALEVMQHAAPGPRVLPDDILLVRTAHDAELFRAVHLAARTDQSDARELVQHFASDAVLLDPAVQAAVRLDAGVPVAVGYLLAAEDAPCGLYWIQTDAGHRRRGHGAAVVQALLAMVPRGRSVLLQATTMGRPVYRRAGFTEHGAVDRWVVTG